MESFKASNMHCLYLWIHCLLSCARVMRSLSVKHRGVDCMCAGRAPLASTIIAQADHLPSRHAPSVRTCQDELSAAVVHRRAHDIFLIGLSHSQRFLRFGPSCTRRMFTSQDSLQGTRPSALRIDRSLLRLELGCSQSCIGSERGGTTYVLFGAAY